MTKPKETPWSGRTTAYEHKDKFPAKLRATTAKGFRKVWMLDAQWSTCPVEVEDQVRNLWTFHEFGNDHYVLRTSVKDLKREYDGCKVNVYNPEKGVREDVPVKTDLIVRYIYEMAPEIRDDEQILIHWWW